MMKNLKLTLVAFTAILFLGMSNVNAQNKAPQTVVIRVYERIAVLSKMIVTDPSGASKKIELKTIKNYAFPDDEISFNNEAIQTEINKWKSEGYTIDALTSGSMGEAGVMVTTVILSKKE